MIYAINPQDEDYQMWSTTNPDFVWPMVLAWLQTHEPLGTRYRSLEEIKEMVDRVVDCEEASSSYLDVPRTGEPTLEKIIPWSSQLPYDRPHWPFF